MPRILRGEIWWADLNPVRGHEQGGKRPVLIISNNSFNARSGTVIAFAITSQPQRARFPLTYELPIGILPKPSWVKMGQVRTISTERLSTKIAEISVEELDRMIAGLNELIGD
jgi:mRNA interferase MazF